MASYELTLSAALAALQKGEISSAQLVESCLERIASTEPKIKACTRVLAEEARAAAASADKDIKASAGNTANLFSEKPLLGVPVTIKELLCLSGHPTSCASKMLKDFVPFYDAEVVSRLKAAGAIIIAQTNMDEFAMGTTTETSTFGRTGNPWNLSKVPGGSSGGSAASVAACQSFASLGSDTGGSIRQPASLCGCVGLKPTYGRVSRYGAVAYASSFDQVGPMARSVEDCARILEVIAGADDKDTASARLDIYPDNIPPQDFVAAALRGAEKPSDSLKGLKLGVPTEFWDNVLSGEVELVCKKALQKFEEAGAVLVPLSIPHQKYSVAVYQIMASAEASTNLARFDGIRYGYRADETEDLVELYTASRSQAFGQEVQRRIMLGTFVLSAGYYDAYYRKAAQIRRLLREDFERAFAACDIMVSSVSPTTAWNFGQFDGDPLAAYKMDLLTVGLNIAGLPGLSMPVGLGGESQMPVGLQLMGRDFDEARLLQVGAALEKIIEPLGTPRGLLD